MQHNTDNKKATVRQKAPTQTPNMKTDTQTQLDKQCNRILSPYEQEQYEKRIRAQAQAGKLAEALRKITTANTEQMPWALSHGEAALAEYEASRQ